MEMTIRPNLPTDMIRMGYPEGAEDNPLYSSIYRSPLTGKWYGIVKDAPAVLVATSADEIWAILIGDTVACWCGSLFENEQHLGQHKGIHGGEYQTLGIPDSAYYVKKKHLSYEDIRANLKAFSETSLTGAIHG